MSGHPSPLQTKGKSFCFWQDQELKLKKRAQHQTMNEKKRRQRNTKDLTPPFPPLQLFRSVPQQEPYHW